MPGKMCACCALYFDISDLNFYFVPLGARGCFTSSYYSLRGQAYPSTTSYYSIWVQASPATSYYFVLAGALLSASDPPARNPLQYPKVRLIYTLHCLGSLAGIIELPLN